MRYLAVVVALSTALAFGGCAVEEEEEFGGGAYGPAEGGGVVERERGMEREGVVPERDMQRERTLPERETAPVVPRD